MCFLVPRAQPHHVLHRLKKEINQFKMFELFPFLQAMGLRDWVVMTSVSYHETANLQPVSVRILLSDRCDCVRKFVSLLAEGQCLFRNTLYNVSGFSTLTAIIKLKMCWIWRKIMNKTSKFANCWPFVRPMRRKKVYFFENLKIIAQTFVCIQCCWGH
jgi:hypothetical protein